MTEEWIKGINGKNRRFKRETLLNYAANNWGLNKKYSVDAVSALIRTCAPKTVEEWESYYFTNAKQQKKEGRKIDREYIGNLGKKLFKDLSEDVKTQLGKINEGECIDYMHNLVINRTYQGYINEINVVYGRLEKELGVEIKSAPDEWDRGYNVDYYIEISGKCIGLQIKPTASGIPLDDYQWNAIFEETHKKFKEKFGGSVFFVYSDKKVISNKEVIEEIKEEMDRLRKQTS